MNLFEKVLSVPSEELSFELRGPCEVPWSDFLLNPRRLRGSDFLMRWSQGQWSEDRLIQAVNETGKYFALPYGPSGTAPEGIREFELYFERLEKAGLGKLKRPDLLLFRKEDHESLQEVIQTIGGTAELPFTAEDHPEMSRLLSMAFLAVECEQSLACEENARLQLRFEAAAQDEWATWTEKIGNSPHRHHQGGGSRSSEGLAKETRYSGPHLARLFRHGDRDRV